MWAPYGLNFEPTRKGIQTWKINEAFSRKSNEKFSLAKFSKYSVLSVSENHRFYWDKSSTIHVVPRFMRGIIV